MYFKKNFRATWLQIKLWVKNTSLRLISLLYFTIYIPFAAWVSVLIWQHQCSYLSNWTSSTWWVCFRRICHSFPSWPLWNRQDLWNWRTRIPWSCCSSCPWPLWLSETKDIFRMSWSTLRQSRHFPNLHKISCKWKRSLNYSFEYIAMEGRHYYVKY